MLVLDAMWAWGRDRWEKERKPIRSRGQQQARTAVIVDADVSAELAASDADVSAEALLVDKLLVQDEKPRRRVVVQV